MIQNYFGIYHEEPWRGDDPLCIGCVRAATDLEAEKYVDMFLVRLRGGERLVAVPCEGMATVRACQTANRRRMKINRDCAEIVKRLGLN